MTTTIVQENQIVVLVFSAVLCNSAILTSISSQVLIFHRWFILGSPLNSLTSKMVIMHSNKLFNLLFQEEMRAFSDGTLVNVAALRVKLHCEHFPSEFLIKNQVPVAFNTSSMVTKEHNTFFSTTGAGVFLSSPLLPVWLLRDQRILVSTKIVIWTS